MTKVTAISRNEDIFEVRFEGNTAKEINYALPVYTNVNMVNKINTSRTEKKVTVKTSVQAFVDVVAVTKEVAEALYNELKAVGKVENIERLGKDNWVARIK